MQRCRRQSHEEGVDDLGVPKPFCCRYSCRKCVGKRENNKTESLSLSLKQEIFGGGQKKKTRVFLSLMSPHGLQSPRYLEPSIWSSTRDQKNGVGLLVLSLLHHDPSKPLFGLAPGEGLHRTQNFQKRTSHGSVRRFHSDAASYSDIPDSIYSYIYNQIVLSLAAMSRPTPDGFKSRNEIVERAFYPVVNATYKNPRKVCKYCYKKMDFNTTRLQEHLDKCQPYRAGKPPNEPVGGTQQFLPNMVAAG